MVRTRLRPIVRAYVAPELGGEGFGYRLRSGSEGTVHLQLVTLGARQAVLARTLISIGLADACGSTVRLLW